MSAMKDIRLWGILVLALGLRTVMLLSVFADMKRARTPDSLDYENLSISLLWGEGYKPAWEAGVVVSKPEIFLTPGYPALLAGAGWVASKTQRDSTVEPLWFWSFAQTRTGS